MNNFVNALVSETPHKAILPEYDLYGELIGDWDLTWTEREGTEEERTVIGEWLFSRTLDGMAVQDLFIVPSRDERKIHPQPDAEYGTTIRFYNPATHNWDIFYGCPGHTLRLEAKREGDSIVQTEILEGRLKWIFSGITKDSFRWEKLICNDTGTWTTAGIVHAKRKI